MTPVSFQYGWLPSSPEPSLTRPHPPITVYPVFETDYKVAVLDYSEGTWGGARPVGQGVYLVGRNGMAAYGEAFVRQLVSS